MKTVGAYTTCKNLRPHFRILTKFAFVNPFSDNGNSVVTNVVAFIIWVVITVYNIQLLIMAFLNRHSTEEVVNASFLMLTALLALLKQFAFTVKLKRIKHLIDLTEGEYFSPKNQAHIGLLDANEKSIGRLYTFYIVIVFMTCMLLYEYPLVNKMLGFEVGPIAAYFPFDTTQSPVFELASTYLTLAITFQGYVNVMIDSIVVTFYAQCRVQLSMLRYDLEHLVDDDDEEQAQEERRRIKQAHYKDSDVVRSRFIHCVKHYQLIHWYIMETQSITAEYMILQIMGAIWTICMTTYKLVGITVLSAETATVIIYLLCMLTQLFLYCYHGSQVLYESQFIATSAYIGDWVSLSPAFRRQLLIFMTRCTRPMVITAGKIVPVQLNSYISVLKASYTLFTFLNTRSS